MFVKVIFLSFIFIALITYDFTETAKVSIHYVVVAFHSNMHIEEMGCSIEVDLSLYLTD